MRQHVHRILKQFALSAAVASAILMIVGSSALAQVPTLTGGTAGNSSLQTLAVPGITYMGPGMGYLTNPGSDAAGAAGEAVPILMSGTANSEHVQQLAVQLSGPAGGDSLSGYTFGVCITHGGNTKCAISGSGVFCAVLSGSSSCSDTNSNDALVIKPGDQVMVKATAVGATPAYVAAKWSLEITP
jgi:hypothetical protein